MSHGDTCGRVMRMQVIAALEMILIRYKQISDTLDNLIHITLTYQIPWDNQMWC